MEGASEVGGGEIGFVQKGHQRYEVWSDGAGKEVMKTLWEGNV